MEKASVSVKIYNSTYALTTSASEEQVLKIAAEVDRRMQELAESKKLKNALRWSRNCSKSAQQQSRKCRKNMLR